MSESEDEDIVACERALWQALQDGNLTRFADFLTDDFQYIEHGGVSAKTDLLNGLREVTLLHYSLDDFNVVRPTADTAAITYRLVETIESPTGRIEFDGFASSVWVEIEGDWRLVLHAETPATPPDAGSG